MNQPRRLAPGDAAETVTARLAAAAKYRDIHPDTIAAVVRQERASTADVAELERRSRARLHKVAALHLYTARPAALRRGFGDDAGGPDARRLWCRRMLATHVSTAERLPDLDRFYPTILALLPAPPNTVADIACALNPFTLPWLRDATGARYTGYDLNAAFAEAGNAFLARHYPGCQVLHQDVLTRDAPLTADLALLLKTYHCIENRQRGAGRQLVDQLAAGHVVVSFPTRAMNGRAAVFARRHLDELSTLASQRGWRTARATLPTEDLLLISKAGQLRTMPGQNSGP
jgi:16S rRNA (guanine(1405)-N(7))-methyltransferase